MVRRLFTLCLFALVAPAAAAQAPGGLASYIAKPEPAFAWKLTDAVKTDAGTVYVLSLTSQTWHEITWTHQIQVFAPADAPRPKTMLLWNTGGKPNAASGLLGLELAKKVGHPIAFLYGVPNQPLFGGKSEDALIAETFVKYLETGDSTWPLLFPMAKSVVKAMDALQAFAKAEWQHEITGFLITGASKRGWTSWLTAASGDKRVKAIAPLVIDTLNFPKQMPHQVKSFGAYSLMIHDYESRKLLPMPDTDAARKLWGMVDPYAYRADLTLPKMIINGTNDPYWTQDALNLYWDDLKGEKHVMYVPNAGHDLREIVVGKSKQVLPTRALATLAAFARCVIAKTPMPELKWETTADGTFSVTADPPAKGVTWWATESDTRDFRLSTWVPTPAPAMKTARPHRPAPKAGKFQAFFAEAEFDSPGGAFTLSTQIRIAEPGK